MTKPLMAGVGAQTQTDPIIPEKEPAEPEPVVVAPPKPETVDRASSALDFLGGPDTQQKSLENESGFGFSGAESAQQ